MREKHIGSRFERKLLMPPTEATIPAVLADRARQQPDDIAYTFVDYDSDPDGVAESLTWSEVHDRGPRSSPRSSRSAVHPATGR